LRFTIEKKSGFLWGLLIGLGFFVSVLLGPNLALKSPADHAFKMLLIVPMYILLVVYLYVMLALLTMRYWLDEKGLHVRWGFKHKYVPFTDIKDIIYLKGNPNIGVLVGFSWPGYIVGYYTIKKLLWVYFLGGDWKKGAIIVSYPGGNLALCPREQRLFLDRLGALTGQQITEIDCSTLYSDDSADRIDQDRGYNALLKFNVVIIAVLTVLLAVCYPGSGAPSILLLFPGLAVAIFTFMIGVASRMYQVMPTMSYLMFMLSIMVAIVFLIISITVIALKLA